MHQFLKFVLGMKIYMFRTVPLSLIRSFSLYTQQWYIQEFFTVHTATVYTIAVCTVKNISGIYHYCVYSEKFLVFTWYISNLT